MAHIGSFVPADSALVGFTDKILTRMQTRETVSSVRTAHYYFLADELQSFKYSSAHTASLLHTYLSIDSKRVYDRLTAGDIGAQDGH